MTWKRSMLFFGLALMLAALSCQPAWSQATVSTGSIQGIVTDPQDAVVVGASVTITSQATDRTIQVTSDASGLYNSGALTPGEYTVHVATKGFQAVDLTITVQVGSIATGNVKLALGAESSVVEVTGNAVTVNTEQAQVQGVVTQEQIENLPSNGRNFLDLAQLEPGVQIQDGANFDPTKTGFSSISFGGRYGRTARIQVDGVDVSDETVGTTTTDIPESAISEFQLAQSSLDMSNDLTSSGAVNVVTRSGSNAFHGEGYGSFRDSSQDAYFPGGGTFQRNQEGGSFGGPVMKNKLFFFVAAERSLQHAGAGVTVSSPFADLTGNFPSPFKEGMALGRIDYQATQSLHLFYRYNYFTNYLIPSFGTPSFSFFANKDISREHVLGADWSSGNWTHSVRFQYLKFQNSITDAVRGSSEPFANFPVSMDFFVSGLATGPSPNAPQATPQSDHQIKYDGSRVWGSHIFRFGAAYNHIHGGGFASFFAFSPLALNFQDSGSYDSTAGLTCPNGDIGTGCPLNYVAEELLIGNGQGYSTAQPAFGRPFGGLGPDNRFAFYLGDSWKIRPNLTLTYGVRYDRDTGRTDSDLPPIPELNLALPGLGNRVTQPNANFGPQIGIAWDPWKTGKTVIRAGIGLYYDNSIFNNVLFDRPPRLQTGTFFFSDAAACFFGSAGPVPFGDGSVQFIPGGNTTCSTGVGAPIPASAVGATCPSGITVAQCMVNFQSAYAASYAANPLGPNPNYIGNLIANGLPLTASIYDPNFKSPRSVQVNIGFQRQLSRGAVLSVDYIRNVGEHFLLGIDANHTGDAAYLNTVAASNAIDTTNASFGCGSGIAGVTCAIAAGAGITDYANNGLDSPKDLNIGECSSVANGIGAPCAFGGINPNIGPTDILYPVGRSVYSGMDVKLTQNARNPLPGIRYLNGEVSYSLSRFVYSGSSNGLANPGTPGNQDQDFIDSSLDNRSPNRFTGPTLLDRTNQFSFGGYADLPFGIQLGATAHFFSPLAVTPLLDVPAGAGSIFQTDFTGDGTVNDPLPIGQTSASCGTVGGSCDYTTYKTGAYGRTLGPGGLTNAISNYDSTIAGKTITPAGQALVNAGLMTEAQLIALGATPQTIAPAVPGAVGLSWLKNLDVQVSWIGHVGERFTIQPSVSFYNVLNFANFDSAGGTLSGALSGSAGSIGYTTVATRTNRIGAGSGLFAGGAPRVIEWGLKFTF